MFDLQGLEEAETRLKLIEMRLAASEDAIASSNHCFGRALEITRSARVAVARSKEVLEPASRCPFHGKAAGS